MCKVDNFPACEGSVKKVGTLLKNLSRTPAVGCSKRVEFKSALNAKPKLLRLPCIEYKD